MNKSLTLICLLREINFEKTYLLEHNIDKYREVLLSTFSKGEEDFFVPTSECPMQSETHCAARLGGHFC